ncbi:hypothetical protein [Planococcus salinus]|uniref:SGNH/GDSL hydrolase family protein n=1 Tax=Planococcus salinus TaxID=1848460 RepID=A0A3M8P4A9_9BACL|nr:hypothetical protein [Planococcus salinus]RNF38497.1 hypothetical protein EEX84_14265 [Planococcus salinus]
MKKRIFQILLPFFCVVALWWTYGQYNHKIQVQGEESLATYHEKMEQKEKDKEQLLNQLAMAKDQTLADRVRYLTLKNGVAKISLVGSSIPVNGEQQATRSSWKELLEGNFKAMERTEVEVKDFGHCGSHETEIVSKDKLEEAMAFHPDILIFEICLPTEGEARSSLPVFQDRVTWAMEELQAGAPEAMIVIQTANPFVNYEIIKPAAGFSYDQYAFEMGKFFESKEWHFFDTHNLMMDKMAENKLTVKELLAGHVLPGSPSYELWAEVVGEHLQAELSQP